MVNALLIVRHNYDYPMKNYRGLSPNYRGKRWAYVHRIKRTANPPIIYLQPTFGLHHEASNSIKNYRGLSPNYRGERWAYVHLIRGAANLPIFYLRPTFGLHHEACKGVYLLILISEAPTNKKYKEKMHIEASKTIFLRSFQ